MDFVRWYSGPVIVGFFLSLLVNPLIAGLGILIWLALIYYVFKTISKQS